MSERSHQLAKRTRGICSAALQDSLKLFAASVLKTAVPTVSRTFSPAEQIPHPYSRAEENARSFHGMSE